MNRRETVRVLAILQGNYPDTYKDMSDDSMAVVINLWAAAFQDEPYEVVQNAVMAFIANSTARFAPNVGMIKEQIRQLTHPRELTAAEAWSMVQTALRNSAYHAVEEFAKLPPVVQKVVGSASNLRSYGMMESETALSVFASNFQKGYRTIQAREAALEKTPLAIREAFGQMLPPIEEPEALPEPVQQKINLPPTGEPIPLNEMRSKIEELRARVGPVQVTEEAKRKAIRKLREAEDIESEWDEVLPPAKEEVP